MKKLLFFVCLLLLTAGAFAQKSKEAEAPEPAKIPNKILFVVSSARQINGHDTGTWFEEYCVPYAYLQAAGYLIDVASPMGGPSVFDTRSIPKDAFASKWADARGAIDHTRSLAKLDLSEYAAIYFPGGHAPMVDLAKDKQVGELIGKFAAEDKPVAAVCHGPAAFLTARNKQGQPFVSGRRIATFTDSEEASGRLAKDVPFMLESELKGQGAQVEKAPNYQPKVVVDGKLVTGQNPASSLGVVEALAKLLPRPTSRFQEF